MRLFLSSINLSIKAKQINNEWKWYLPLLFIIWLGVSTSWADEQHQHSLGSILIGADLRYLRPYNCNKEAPRSCIFPDVIKSLLEPLQLDFDLVPSPEPRKYIDMANGHLDAAIIFTTDSLQHHRYPDTVHICPKPIVSTWLSIFTRHDKNLKIASLADLSKYHLVALRLPEFQRDMIGTREFKNVTRTKSLEQMMRIILADRGDYFIFEKFSTFHHLDAKNLDNKIIWNQDITRLDYHIALSHRRTQKNPKLHQICEEINQQTANGKIAAIVESYTNPLAINDNEQ